MAVAAVVAFGLAAKKDAYRQERGGNARIGQTAAQRSMMHGKRGVQEPYRCAQKPDPVEITGHYPLGCAARGGRHLSRSIVNVPQAGTNRTGLGFRADFPRGCGLFAAAQRFPSESSPRWEGHSLPSVDRACSPSARFVVLPSEFLRGRISRRAEIRIPPGVVPCRKSAEDRPSGPRKRRAGAHSVTLPTPSTTPERFFCA